MRKGVIFAVILAGLCGQSMAASTISDRPSVAVVERKIAKNEFQTGNQMPVSRGIIPNKVAADAEDVELLARAIYAEARGEPFLGQVAVGAVIINRVHNKGFPSTIRDVIYQPGALCTVKDGQINLKPGETARRAALLALSGVDPTEGSLFFYNPVYATAKWTKKKPIAAEIGNHVFAR